MKNLYLEIDTIGNPEQGELVNEIMASRGLAFPSTEAITAVELRDRLVSRLGETAKLAGLSFWVETPAEPAFNGDSGWIGMTGSSGPITEEKLLAGFWRLVTDADRIIVYGGHVLSFLLARSAMLEVKPTRMLYNIKPWEFTITDLTYWRWQGSVIRPTLRQALALNKFECPGFLTTDQIANMHLGETNEPPDFEALRNHGKAKVMGLHQLATRWQGYFVPMLQPVG